MLKSVAFGPDFVPRDAHLPRHRHLEAYAIVLVRGVFDQVSYAGRVRVTEGDVLIQPTLDCHANRMVSDGARIFRLPWEHGGGLGGLYRLRDLDAVARIAERDAAEATLCVRDQLRQGAHRKAGASDWPDVFAAQLVSGDVTAIGGWAEQLGLARETVARGFVKAYGVSPRRFRLETKVRNAWLAVVETNESLASIAARLGFSDQPHLTRAMSELTGWTPAAWRRMSRPSAACA
jgi:AraC-like DNA-binding protein